MTRSQRQWLTRLVLFSTLVLFGFVLAGSASLGGRTSRAQPAPPATFAGGAFFVAVPAASGTFVEARVAGATCGVDRVFIANGESRYAMHVKAAGPEGGACGGPGALVDFYLGGVFAGSAPWESGLTVFDLHAIRPPEGGQGPGATPTPAAGVTPVASPTPRPVNTGGGDGTVVPTKTPLPDPCATGGCAGYQLGRDGKRTVGQAAAVRLDVRLTGQVSISDPKRVQGLGVAAEQRPACTDAELDTYAATPRPVYVAMFARLLPAEGVDGITVNAAGQTGATGWRSPQQLAGGDFRWDWGITAARPGTFEYKVEVSDQPDGVVHADWFCAVDFAPVTISTPTHTPTATATPTPTHSPTATVTPTVTPPPPPCQPDCPKQRDGFPKWLFLLAVPVAGLLGGAGWAKRTPIIAFATYRMTPPTVFLSYRRDDKDRAELISVSLNAKLGKEHVFHDVRDLTAGEDFPDALARKITGCDVLLAIIGKTWLGTKADGTRRIDAGNDWVRKEVAHALSAGKGVIPVLVDGASLPREEELPGDLVALRSRNAPAIAGGENYDASIDRLVKGIYAEAKRSRATRKNRPSVAMKP